MEVSSWTKFPENLQTHTTVTMKKLHYWEVLESLHSFHYKWNLLYEQGSDTRVNTKANPPKKPEHW